MSINKTNEIYIFGEQKRKYSIQPIVYNIHLKIYMHCHDVQTKYLFTFRSHTIITHIATVLIKHVSLNLTLAYILYMFILSLHCTTHILFICIHNKYNSKTEFSKRFPISICMTLQNAIYLSIPMEYHLYNQNHNLT